MPGVYADLAPRYRPRVTRGLIALLFAFYALQVFVLDDANWLLLGALVQEGEWWRIVTGALMHAPPNSEFSVFHLLMNSYFGWLIGRSLEQHIGPWRMVLLSVVSMLGAGLATTYMTPLEPTVGFSGVLYGWMGSWLGFHLTSRFPALKLRGEQMKAYRNTLLINLVLTFAVASISWTGHLGGLVTGFAAALVLGSGSARSRDGSSGASWA